MTHTQSLNLVLSPAEAHANGHERGREILAAVGAVRKFLNPTEFPGATQAREDLKRAGWSVFGKGGGHVWESPNGQLYRGPALAWHVAMGLPWPPKTEPCNPCMDDNAANYEGNQ